MAPTSRWAKTVGSVAMALTGKLVFSPPADGSATVPLGLMLSSPSRQPISLPSVCSWIGVGAMSSKLPIIATPPAVAIEAAGVVALHRTHQCAGPALEHLAVLVDDCVVGDVAPAEDLGVIRVDRPHDRHGILWLVVVALGGVVDHRGADRLIERPVTATHRFVGAPLRASDDVGRLPGADGGRR